MAMSFSDACERDIRQAQHVRVAVYPAVRGWCAERVQLEVSDCPQQLGFTSPAHQAGHYLVVDTDPAEVVAAVNARRGSQLQPATVVMIQSAGVGVSPTLQQAGNKSRGGY